MNNNASTALQTLQDTVALLGPDTVLTICAESWSLHALGSRFTGPSDELDTLVQNLSSVARFEIMS